MAKISSKAAGIAVAALLMGIGVGLSIDLARAEDTCASAPGAAAPKGQHWYYRIDRATQRKCWYLHAIMATPSRAAAELPAAHSQPAAPVATPQWPSAAMPQTTNAASTTDEPETISNPANEVVGTQPEPRVTELKVKTVNAPSIATTAPPEPATPEQTNEPSMPQISQSDADAKPVRGAKLATAQAAPAAAHAVSAPNDPAVTGSPRTPSANLLFLLAALAIGIAAALIALSGRMARVRRAPPLSQQPEDAWRSYGAPDQQAYTPFMHQDDAPFLAPHEPYVAVDLDAPELPEQWPSPQPRFPAAPRQDRKSRQPGQVGLTQKDIEMALRILRQPVRGVVASGKGPDTQSS